MIKTTYPYGSVNFLLVKYIVPFNARGHYHMIDTNGNRYRIDGKTYDYLQEMGVKIYETKANRD